jgi:cell division protein FtsN
MASAILIFVMEDRIKQRLTGAAIVVAVMVLLVPEMFRGRPQSAPVAAGNAAGGPPLRSYTIELRDGASRQGTANPETSGTPALAAPPQTAPGAPAAPTAADAGAIGASTGAPQAAGAAPPPPQPPVATLAAAPPGTPAAASSSPSSPAPAPAAAAPGTANGPAADSGRYQVQLGLFASRANAERLAAKAGKQGVRARVSGPDARGLYRVHTPTYDTRSEALAVQQKLRELGLTAALTPQR